MPDAHIEQRRGPYTLSSDPARLDMDVIYDFLAHRAYWSQNIPRPVVERAIQNSLCLGIYLEDRLVGFARVITDYATMAYLSDVFILEEYRGQGLSKWLMETLLDHPGLQGLRRWCLATRDAHGLYARYGFTPLVNPEAWMEIKNSAPYPD